ncbi:fibronectin type III and SPRY domain-containing protein 2 [Hyperolius riggenbachi]|uniref:fibronectin type III and SPRY domain-containing protein 2 n=1 Tax=Hyperolius riggenbachi TaxID=752182 RepID=UPI0035A3B627
MESDAVEEYDTAGLDNIYIALREVEDQLEPIEEETEPEEEGGLSFYHPDLYDDQGRQGIFPKKVKEDPEEQKHEAAQEQSALSPDHVQSDEQKEVDELAKLYGLSDDRDLVEDPFMTQPYRHTPAQHKVPGAGALFPKQKKTGECAKEVLPNEDKSSHLPDNRPDNAKTGEALDHHTEEKQEKTLEKYNKLPQSEDGEPTQEKQHVKHADPAQEKLPSDIPEDSTSKVDNTDDKQHSAMEISSKSGTPPDIFCVECKVPIKASEKSLGIHKVHRTKEIFAAVEDMKEDIHKSMCKLEEQITQVENFAGHLEEIFITVEENYGRQEQNFEMHYTEVMDTIASKHEEKLQVLGEEKKAKLESLFEQLVNCGKRLDISKDLMETIQKLFNEKNKVAFVKTALDATNRLHDYFNTDINLTISTNAEFENNSQDFSEVEKLLESINTLPVPSAPVINPQAPNSATATSLRVCWSLFSEDTVEHYKLFYKPVSDGAPGENRQEFMIRSKETYCTVTNLMPNTQYELWVIGINASGESPASENAVYVTAPAPPIIKSKECLSCENAAFIYWESGTINPVDSYTVEIHKAAHGAEDSSISESIVGIPICECLIQLQTNETYHISVRAVNVGGPSESSTSVSIHTTGTFFYLNEDTAHPLLSISEDGFTISCEQEESLEDLPYHCNNFSRCIAVLGNLIPLKGKHYWEVEVDERTEYRIGVAYEDTNRSAVLGANNSSWCLRHICTPKRHKYEFLHCGVSPEIRISIPPRRIGILLDYDCERVSFFNMDIQQHLYSFQCHFRHLVHPCFALEKRGRLRIHNGIPVPHSLIVP